MNRNCQVFRCARLDKFAKACTPLAGPRSTALAGPRRTAPSETWRQLLAPSFPESPEASGGPKRWKRPETSSLDPPHSFSLPLLGGRGSDTAISRATTGEEVHNAYPGLMSPPHVRSFLPTRSLRASVFQHEAGRRSRTGARYTPDECMRSDP